MPKRISQRKVCVTGASGFIASYIVKELLQRGYYVKGTVRDTQDEEKTASLREIAKDLPGHLELVSANLEEAGSFDYAVEDCEFVCHVASPVIMRAKDPQKEIVDAAVNGTINVFESILKARAAKRVVMTSSRAAVVFGKCDPIHTYTEADWNTFKDINIAPYPVSKTLAEQTAWNIYREQPVDGWRFELVTTLPGVALGPVSVKQHLHTSPQVIYDLMRGHMPMAPDVDWEYVDVRDVAAAHANILENDNAAGRYLLLNGNCDFLETAAILRSKYPRGYSLPSRKAPNWIIRFLCLFRSDISWPFLKQILGVRTKFSNEKAKRELGVSFRPVEESILATADSLVINKFV